VLALAKKAGKASGIFAATPEKAKAYAIDGFELIAVGMDTTVLLNAYRSIQATIPR
jgi:2-keto-3-deoxy-L-rhamnonate aldolase RhmA